MTWTKCEDDLPASCEEVLIFLPAWKSGIRIGWIHTLDMWYVAGEGTVAAHAVTHWMPLPSPPGGETK